MNWSQLAKNAPQIIGLAMTAAEAIKGAKGAAKEAAVIATAKQAMPIIEDVSGVDVNDASFDALLAAYIQSRVALQNFITKKAAPPEGVMVPAPPA